jgi:hypothetical protein
VRAFPLAPGTSGPNVDGILLDDDAVWYECGHELCCKDDWGTRVLGPKAGFPIVSCWRFERTGSGNLWVQAQNSGMFELPLGQTRFRKPDLPVAFSAIGGVPAIDAGERILLPSPRWVAHPWRARLAEDRPIQ